MKLYPKAPGERLHACTIDLKTGISHVVTFAYFASTTNGEKLFFWTAKRNASCEVDLAEIKSITFI